jgi:hypothetical protein
MADPILELRRVLHGVFRLDLADGCIRIRIGPLPDHMIAAGVVEDHHMYLFIDREKPGAIDHARELLAAHPELVLCNLAGVEVTRDSLMAENGAVADFILRQAEED